MEISRKGLTNNNNNGEVACFLMTCGVCEENYNEDRTPRILECGHSLCEACANQSFPLYKRCSECYLFYTRKEAKDLPTNYPVLRFLHSYEKKSVNVKDILGPAKFFPVSLPPDSEQESWKCPVHCSPTAFFCASCHVWICQDCMVVEHPGLPRGSCRIISIVKAIEKLKRKFQKETRVCVGQVESIKNNLEPETEMLNFLMKHCPSDDKSHSRIILRISELLDKLKEQDKSVVRTSMAQMKKTLKAVKKTTSPKEITTLCKTLADCQSGLKEYIAEEKERKKSLKQEIMLHLAMDLKLLVGKEGRPAYAVYRESPSRSWWGHISCINERLLVSSLREGNPPEEGFHIPYEYVRGMVHKNYPTVFFDIGTADKTQGLVHIRLQRDCPRIRNFIELCSGEKGMCYKGSSLFHVQYSPASLFGGDLENNDGTGSDDTINASEDHCPEVPVDANYYYLHFSYGSFSKFSFCVGHSNLTYTDIMGKVTEGTEVVKKMCKSESISGIIVRECGFIIPRTIEEDQDKKEGISS